MQARTTNGEVRKLVAPEVLPNLIEDSGRIAADAELMRWVRASFESCRGVYLKNNMPDSLALMHFYTRRLFGGEGGEAPDWLRVSEPEEKLLSDSLERARLERNGFAIARMRSLMNGIGLEAPEKEGDSRAIADTLGELATRGSAYGVAGLLYYGNALHMEMGPVTDHQKLLEGELVRAREDPKRASLLAALHCYMGGIGIETTYTKADQTMVRKDIEKSMNTDFFHALQVIYHAREIQGNKLIKKRGLILEYLCFRADCLAWEAWFEPG